MTPVSPEPTATPPASASSPIGSAPPSSVAGAAIGDYLPVKLDGVELHTFAVAQDVTARLGQAVGAPLELAYASEHGARFIQTIAIRAPGTDASALAMLFPAAAFPPDGATADVSEADLGGEGVTAVADPAATARLGTYYLLARDDVLIVVETFTPEDAADMIGALPSP
ncbi:MAG TPA: hypothetical protein VJ975_12365 [Candidatus Limnocylindria bacterium]|nr:hypothetical protein [Candidatus Limnocylindria bacterium]